MASVAFGTEDVGSNMIKNGCLIFLRVLPPLRILVVYEGTMEISTLMG